MNAEEIARCRALIDSYDAQLLALLNRRSAVALQLGELKREAGLSIVDATRESSLMLKLLEANRGPLDDGAVNRIFTLIIQESRQLQHSKSIVSGLGIPHEAAQESEKEKVRS